MKIYNLDYNVGGHGYINLDVELDITPDHPDFMRKLDQAAMKILIQDIKDTGEIELVYGV